MCFKSIFNFLFAYLRFMLLFGCVFVLFVLFGALYSFCAFCACKILSWKKNKKFETSLIKSFILLLKGCERSHQKATWEHSQTYKGGEKTQMIQTIELIRSMPIKIWNCIGRIFSFFNWDSLHARLSSHYEAWSYKKRTTKSLDDTGICLERTYS